ncbi:MAG: PAS domain S-box protein, partial [Desulfomonile tiedjei]|nr:PAS domain S-box protein [Desulfomonile tiedjei]
MESATLLKKTTFEIDSEGNVLLVGPGEPEILGYSQEDFAEGLSIKDLFSGEQLDRIVRQIGAILNGERPEGSEYTLVRRDGTLRDIYMYCTPIMRNNSEAGVRAECLDLGEFRHVQETQQKLREELDGMRKVVDELQKHTAKHRLALNAVRQSEQMFKAIVESCPVGIIISEDEKIKWANQAWINMHGFESSYECLGLSERAIYDSQDAFDRAERMVLSSLETSKASGIWTKQIRKDGSVFDAHVAMTALKTSDPGTAVILTATADVSDRTSSAGELQHPEADFRANLDSTPYAFFALDVESGRILYGNQRMSEMFGNGSVGDFTVDPKSLINGEDPLSRQVHQEDRAVLSDRYRRLLESGEAFDDLQLRLQTNSGRMEWVSVSAVLIRQNARISALWFLKDITTRKLQEGIASQTEKSFRQVVEAANDIIYITDEHGILTYVNPSVANTIGYPRNEVVGKHYTELIAPEYKELAEGFYAIQLAKKIPDTYYEFPIVTKRGEIIWLGQHVQLMMEKERIVGFQGICRDITDRRRTDESLRESEKRFRQLAESVNDIFMVIRPGMPYSFIYVSPAYERLTARSASELKDNPAEWLSLVHEDDRIRIKRMFDSFVQASGEFNGEFRITGPGGEVRWLWATGAPIKDSEGKVYRLAITLRDVTQRKSDQAKLENLVEEIKNFAYIVSHDFRAPLINIKGFSRELEVAVQAIKPAVHMGLPQLNEGQKLQALNALEEDLPEALEFINSSVSQMDKLINAILDLSRLERRELKLELLNMKILVENVLKGLNFQLSEANAKVCFGGLPDTIADGLCMGQIMTNLLTNAVKFSVPGRPQQITITGWRFPDETVFVIRDQGRGVESA